MDKATAILMLSVATLLTLSLSVVFINETPDKTVEGWQYDDYVPAEDADVVGGVFEIVTVGGVDYIHADGVGQGTINGETFNVKKAQLDLAFICGQSNAAYRNPDPSQVSPVPRVGTAYYFGLSDRYGPTPEETNTGMDISACAIWDMVDLSTGALRIGDKGPSYAATYYQETGHKVLWVCGAIGNKSIIQFNPNGGFMWNYQASVLSAALSLIDRSLFDLNVNYYLWCQGEANKSTAVSSYIAQFVTMNDAMLAGDCAGVRFDGAVISKVRALNGGNASTAQIELTETFNTIHMGSVVADTFTIDNGLIGSDDLHYSQLGNNLIGADLADFVVSIEYPASTMDNGAIDVIHIIPAVLIIALLSAAIAIAFKTRY